MTGSVFSEATQAHRHGLVLLLTAFLALLVGILTLLPLPTPAGLPGNDKLHHMAAFAGLILPAAILAPRLLWVLLPLLAFYGGLIEIVQPWVGRDSDVQDALADLAGLLIGLTAGLTLRRLLWPHLRFGAPVPAEACRSSH